ncbi:hypothetical protein LTR70_009088 [Exophiala xenobiotica]|uniref:Uncharacterized protein n=1 Tax=Lithohypha guttulata TaxID=1690604 RepID=A0ABR0JVR9_9EURO|nr:hypothetical protein LTR24_009960 [Lithohypha guttulata]KAK5311008.1 hypothetical protein LTR70_009088 [Exophiala xenobiotica]
MSGAERVWRESAEKIAGVASELDVKMEALKEVLRDGEGEVRLRSLQEILGSINVMTGMLAWKEKAKQEMDGEVLKKTWLLQIKEMEMLVSLREEEKEKMRKEAESKLRQEFEEKYREKLHEWERQREASLKRELDERKKELEDQLQKRSVELAAKERRLDGDRILHADSVKNFGIQREKEAGLTIKGLRSDLKVKELENADLQRRLNEASAAHVGAVNDYNSLVERRNALVKKLGDVIIRRDGEIAQLKGENERLSQKETELEDRVKQVARLCTTNLRRDISRGVADGLGDALTDLADGVRSDVQEVVREAIDALPGDGEPVRKRQRLDDHHFNDGDADVSEAGGESGPFMSGAVPVPVPIGGDDSNGEEDFGDASEEMKEALRRVEFPAGFDTRNFVIALRAAVTAGRKSRARIPSKWMDRLHWVHDSKVSVCVLGKLSQHRGGYSVATGMREDCACHRGKEGICVRLEERTGEEQSEKWWNLIEN